MLRKLTEILDKPIRMFPSREDAERVLAQERKEQEKQILNLFKAEVGKLTVIDDEGLDLRKWVEDRTGNTDLFYHSKGVLLDLGDKFMEAQLQADKDKLLDLMGE